MTLNWIPDSQLRDWNVFQNHKLIEMNTINTLVAPPAKKSSIFPPTLNNDGARSHAGLLSIQQQAHKSLLCVSNVKAVKADFIGWSCLEGSYSLKFGWKSKWYCKWFELLSLWSPKWLFLFVCFGFDGVKDGRRHVEWKGVDAWVTQ